MVALSLKNPYLPEDDLVGTKAHGWPPSLGLRWLFGSAAGEPHHDQNAPDDESEQTASSRSQ
jgi:hypothetical protein